MEKFDSITAWLKKHEAINLSVIAREIKYDRDNLYKAIKGVRKLPETYIPALEKALKNYGYEPSKC
jgi:hypothetical protein